METEKETGFLYCRNSILGHVGVQQYNGYEVGITDQEVIDVIREPEDVFDEDSLASMDGKPITLYHPDEMVTSENFKKYAVGFIKNVHRDGDLIIGDLVINDMEAIEKVLDGDIKDLSLGYQAKLVPTGDGRLKQKDIVINHLAIVPEGRAQFARIVDSKTVTEKGENTDMGLFSKKDDKVELQDAVETVEEEMQDEEMMKPDTQEVEDEEEEKEELQDDEASDKEHLEKELEMKDFKYFMNQYKEIKDMPSGEFRQKAYDSANSECMTALGVSLPMLDAKPKASAIEKSVGLADNLTVEDQPIAKKEAKIDARAEERFFSDLYRSFDYKSSNPVQGKDNARKYGDMNYQDVISLIEKKGGIK